MAKKVVKKKVAPKKVSKPAAKKAPAKKSSVKKTTKPVAKKVVKPVAKKTKPAAKAAAPKAKVVAKKPAKPVKPAKIEAKKPAKPAKPIKVAKAPKAEKIVAKPTPAPKVALPKPERGRGRAKNAMKNNGDGETAANTPARPTLATIQHKQTQIGYIKRDQNRIPANAPKSTDTRSRYNDSELAEFKQIVLKKLEETRKELVLSQAQLNSANEHGTDDTASTFKMLEDGSDSLAKEEAAALAGRQKKFIEQLEAALMRIENKTYGICRVTGKLIPKERLKAVPVTTQSIEAKLNQYRD
ncbi:MAG: hypothetical protein RIQ89_1986 [Bacteroidota bacterium]|jgi:RNA polymerase-binding transcription factor DksA